MATRARKSWKNSSTRNLLRRLIQQRVVLLAVVQLPHTHLVVLRPGHLDHVAVVVDELRFLAVDELDLCLGQSDVRIFSGILGFLRELIDSPYLPAGLENLAV